MANVRVGSAVAIARDAGSRINHGERFRSGGRKRSVKRRQM